MLTLRDPNLNARYHPEGQLAGVPAPPLRGERHHHVDAFDPQRRSGHRDARQPGLRAGGRARLGRHRLRRADELRPAHRPHQLHAAEHRRGAGDGAQRRLPPADPRAGRPAHRRRRRRRALRHVRQVPRRLQGAAWLPDRAVGASTTTCWGRRTSTCTRRRCCRRSSRGCLESGRDLIDGGAKYNSSGSALVSVADVIDSLLVDQATGLRGEGGRLPDAAAGPPRRLRRPRGAARPHHEARPQVRLRRAGHAGDGAGHHRLHLRRVPVAGELPRRTLHQRLLEHVEPRRLRLALRRAAQRPQARQGVHARHHAHARRRRRTCSTTSAPSPRSTR